MVLIKCCTLLLVAGLSLAQQQTPHNHPETVVSEYYRITVVMLPRGAETPVRVSWTISPEDGVNDRNIKLTYDAINAFAHSRPRGLLRNRLGYQGMEIDHVINGVSAHVWPLPACASPRLERGIVQFTSGNNLSFEQKQQVYYACRSE